jgi:SAM-dependent methyltransferase
MSMSRTGIATWSERERPAPSRVERVLERAVALAYGATYDAIVHGFGPYDDLVHDIVRALAYAGNGRPLRVLDVACGTGTVAAHLARAGHTVVGLDLVGHLVTRALRREGEGLAFGHGDVAAGTGFADGIFDACVSLHTLNWHPRPLALLQECRRVLRPGGHAVILSYTRPTTLGATFRSVRATDGLGAALGALRWLAPTAMFEACRHYEARYPDPDALHRELAAAGFDIVESRPAFLAGVSRLVWARRAASDSHPAPH